jgi:hypothetical protein
MVNSIPTLDMPQSDGDGLTTCHVCSIPHIKDISVKRGRLGGISETPLLLLLGIKREWYVCMYVSV